MVTILGKIFVARELQETRLRITEEIYKEFLRLSTRNYVIAEIEKAAKMNLKKAQVYGWLSYDLKEELHQKGYMLTEYTYALEPMTAIEWSS